MTSRSDRTPPPRRSSRAGKRRDPENPAGQQAHAAAAPAFAVRELKHLIRGAIVSQAIFIVSKLGIADLLRGGAKTAGELADATGTHAPSLYRVMRALATLGIFAEDAGGRFVLTPLAEPLRGDHPDTVRPFAIMNGERWVWGSLGEIEHSVRTGKPAFDHVFGAPLFDYYAANPQAGQVSADALNSLSRADNAAIVKAYDFAGAGRVVDVGGGQGSLLATVLAAHPDLRGVLVERPPVIEMAKARLQAALVDRCEFVAADFFTAIPAIGDIYIMKKVIHDWNDEDARRILRRCREAMPVTSRLLLVDAVVPVENRPSETNWVDLLMLVYAGGRERTEKEHRDLLASAGFALVRIIPTTSFVSIIEATPQ